MNERKAGWLTVRLRPEADIQLRQTLPPYLSRKSGEDRLETFAKVADWYSETRVSLRLGVPG